MRSLRLAVRSLARTPVVSLAVALSLGLGIGANTAIFSLMHQILLRSLPVPEPQELVTVNSPGEFKNGRNSTDDSGGTDAVFSYRAFRALEANPQGVRGVAAYRQIGANLSYHGRTVSGSALMASGGYFPVLGVQAMFGRTLTWEDDRGAGQPAAVLSYGFWKDKLGGEPDVLNQPVRVNGQMFTIVGVLPKGFTGVSYTQNSNVYVPLVFKPGLTPGWDGRDRYDDYWLYVFGRLEPGTTPARAAAGLQSTYRSVLLDQVKTVKGNAAYRKRFLESRLFLLPAQTGQTDLGKELQTPLYILMACSALVLLIAAGNAANLLLARAVQRSKEMAIRAALGAGRWPIIRQLLTEAMILSLAACALGLLLADWTLSALVSVIGGEGQGLSFVVPELEWPVLLFCLGVSIVTGLLFGMYPAWTASRAALSGTLQEESNRSSSTRGGVRVRKALVCAQVTLSILLLVPMGLFLKSLVNLLHANLGLNSENLIAFSISPDLNGYKPEQSRALFERAEDALAAIPGVRTVTAAMVPLIAGSNWGSSVKAEGFERGADADTHSVYNEVGAGFFGKMGIPLMNGREFNEADTLGRAKVAVVNQTLARYFFGNTNPIGRKFSAGTPDGPDTVIVGVVKDAKYSSVRQEIPRQFFRPYRQDEQIGSMTFYVRTGLDPGQIAPQIRRVMRELDPDLPLQDLRPFEQQVELNILSDRIVLQLASAFAILATFLALLGLYGVTAYGVTRRRREFGIRMALGAGSASIRRLVLREVAAILAAGVFIGVPAALGLARLVQTQLFGVKAFDFPVLAAAIGGLSIAGLLAGYLPALSASRTDPQRALRYE